MSNLTKQTDPVCLPEIFKDELASSCRIKDGIYSFVDKAGIAGDNLKYAKMYDRIAWSYNISQRLFFWLKFGGERKFREPFLQELNIKPNDRVLEISTGTCDNFRFLDKRACYYGLDISMGMLRQGKKHLRKWRIRGTLVHGEGERLPFKDASFDVVFHCGGINFFNDKKRAIDEMIRVAKSGTRILIVDETEKLVRENYQKNPFIRSEYQSSSKARIPLDLVPEDALDLKAEVICKGLMYKLTFIKP